MVQSILCGFRIKINERDLPMNSGFLSELKGILGQRSKLTLLCVFIGGRYIGGAKEVRQLHMAGGRVMYYSRGWWSIVNFNREMNFSFFPKLKGDHVLLLIV